MKIACVGAGPAGLYFAISMKLRDASHEIAVFERNPPGVTFGWGVVFSDQTVENLQHNDPKSAQVIADEFAHWDDIEVRIAGRSVVSSGHGFIGIGRKRLLEILLARARELGVHVTFECEDDGRDGSPAAGSSDSPESMDEYDPLRRRERLAGEDIGDLAGSGSHIEVLGEDDDDPEW